MNSLLNVIAGTIVGFFLGYGLSGVVLHFNEPSPWDTAPGSPDPSIGAIYPINKHGTPIYWTAAQVHAEHVMSFVGGVLTTLLVTAYIIMPKSNVESKVRWYAFRARWDLDDPRHIFKAAAIVGGAAGVWFTVVGLPRLIAELPLFG